MKKKIYYKSFYIAGFTYCEGPLLMKKLKIGRRLKLKAEPKNKFDDNAVAIYYKKRKIGFVPKNMNYSISKLLLQGYNPFCAVIQQKDKKEHPEQQIRVVLYIEPNTLEEKISENEIIVKQTSE